MKSQMEMRNILLEREESDPWYKMAKNLAELCCSVLCEVELVSGKRGYLAERFLNKVLKRGFSILIIV